MHFSTLSILTVAEIITLVVLLPLRHHLLRLAGLQQGKATSLVFTDSYDLAYSKHLLWFIYKVLTPVTIVLVATPVSVVFFYLFHVSIFIVLPALIVITAIYYVCTDGYQSAIDEIDCAFYRSRHYNTHNLPTPQITTPYYPQSYHRQTFHTNPDAVACRTHIH